jgi:hypothetical protein
LQEYENEGKDHILPLDAFPRLFPKLVFIILVDDPEDMSDGDGEEFCNNDHIHLYGGISPMELVVASCTRRPWIPVQRSDGKGSAEGTGEDPVAYSRSIHGITIYKDARFLTNDQYLIEFLQRKKTRTNPFDWSFSVIGPNDYENSPKLDVTRLSKDNDGWEETLQGCIWLSQTNIMMAVSTDEYFPGLAVACRSDMVLPLVQTVSSALLRIHFQAKYDLFQFVTQKPSEFFFTVTDELSVTEFVDLTNSVTDLIKSFPVLTQQVNAEVNVGQDPFLEIRAGEIDYRKKEWVHRHQAIFLMETHVDPRELNDMLFWVTIWAETWHEEQEIPGVEGTEGWMETVETEVLHSLGPYRRVRRIC